MHIICPLRCMHRYRKSQNRLLKVCCVPATSAGLPRVSFFFSFLFLLQWPFTLLIKQTRQAVCAVKQSIYSQMSMGVCYTPNCTPPLGAACRVLFSGMQLLKIMHSTNAAWCMTPTLIATNAGGCMLHAPNQFF